MRSDFDCPHSNCDAVAVRLDDTELAEGKTVTCQACGSASHLMHVPEPSAHDLWARSWVLIAD